MGSSIKAMIRILFFMAGQFGFKSINQFTPICGRVYHYSVRIQSETDKVNIRPLPSQYCFYNPLNYVVGIPRKS